MEFSSNIRVKLLKECASDADVVEAMLVSTLGEDSLDAEANFGRINFLMKNRHGTPFEHTFFKFWVQAPIFVFREFHRHRIGWSYNEESGRYSQLKPHFYTPPHDRDLVQVGKPGAYTYVPGDEDQRDMVYSAIRDQCTDAYLTYEMMLNAGVAREVARMVLPVNIFSSMYATCNARSLMAFLSLRQRHSKREPHIVDDFEPDGAPRIEWEGEATYPSTPMKEINVVADEMEYWFESLMPMTHRAFVQNGYVCP